MKYKNQIHIESDCGEQHEYPYTKIMIIEYWLWASKESKNDINTWSTIVSILSESHQDLGVTETFFWTCYYPLWCNSCCGDTRIVYKCCLHDGNLVAKDSGVVTTNRSCIVKVNKRQGTRCMLDTWWGYSCGLWVHMGVSKHIIWIICGF